MDKIVTEQTYFLTVDSLYIPNIFKAFTKMDIFQIEDKDDVTYGCVECDYDTFSKKKMSNHRRNKHERDKIYECKHCDFKAPFLREKKQHMKNEHKVKSHACKRCEFNTPWLQELKTHKRNTHKRKTYECLECDIMALYMTDFRNHMTSQHGVHKMFVCQNCDFKAAEGKLVRRHQRAVHEGVSYDCAQCNYKSSYQRNIYHHTREKHQQSKFSCEKCDFNSPWKVLINRHKNIVHEGFRYKCEICDYNTTKPHILRQHTKSKHKGVRYECDQCDFKALRQEHLTNHVNSKHAGLMYTCDQCDYKVSWPAQLYKHKQITHKGLMYSCDQCDYKAIWQTAFIRHMQTWHEQLTYCCNQCDTAVEEYEKLKVHFLESQHVGFSFGCINCNFKAITKGILAKHKQKAHKVYGVGSKHKKSPEEILNENTPKLPYIKGQRTKMYKPYKKTIISEFQELNDEINSIIAPGINIMPDGRRSRICRICGKEGQNGHIRTHIEGMHIDCIGIQCNMCEKILKSRDSLRQHKYKQHS